MVTTERRHAGYSLMELLISVALMSVVVLYLMQSFSTQQRTYVMVDEVTEAQQNLRAISDVMEREVRMAGFMVDQAGAVCGIDRTNGPDTLVVSDGAAIDPSAAIQPTMGARTSTAPAAGTVTINFTGGDTVVLEGNPALAAYDTNGDGVRDSDFQVNGGAIVYDRNNPARGAACGTVTAVPSNTSVRVNFPAGSATLSAGGVAPQLVVIPAHLYQITNFQLLRDGLVLAEDVEDLQVAYFFDTNGNGTIDAGENPGSAGTAYTASGSNNTTLRELRVNFVARTRGTDPTFTQGAFQTVENRTALGTDTQDPQRRRRVHTTTVRIRNVGNRGLLS